MATRQEFQFNPASSLLEVEAIDYLGFLAHHEEFGRRLLGGEPEGVPGLCCG